MISEQLADELVLMFISELSLKVHVGCFSHDEIPCDLVFGFKDLSLFGILICNFLGYSLALAARACCGVIYH
jgi:hypothetical protein